MADPESRKHHLWIQVTPEVDGGAVFVNLTDADNIPDGTVILAPGDHPFVSKPSAVYFRKARVLPIPVLRKGIDDDLIFPHEALRGEVLERITAGLLASPFTPRNLKRLVSSPVGGKGTP